MDNFMNIVIDFLRYLGLFCYVVLALFHFISYASSYQRSYAEAHDGQYPPKIITFLRCFFSALVWLPIEAHKAFMDISSLLKHKI